MPAGSCATVSCMKWLFGRRYVLYAVTIFLSAFLLFLIQPLIGRVLLPWFGGASSVWATGLLFFTAMLFLGYAYAYSLSRRAFATQARIHLWVIGIGCATVLAYLFVFNSVFPPLDWTIGSALSPSLLVLLSLLIMIGIPYFLLATTGPLLQYWFAIKEAREPYQFYILSNLGSFIALGTYPFVIEPLFRLSTQRGIWTALFILFAVLYGVLAYHFLRAARSREFSSHENTRDDGVISYTKRIQWMLYATLPAMLMAATTTELTQTIAPVPFLWVLPLGLYLLTFIVAFRGWGGGGLNAVIILTLAGMVFWIAGYQYEAVTRQMFLYLAFFFAVGVYCHAQLYASRPSAPHSALFYLFISLGGVVGTLIVSIVAPLVFNDWLEFPLGIMAAALSAVILFPAMRYVRDEYTRPVVVMRAIVLFVVAAVGMYNVRTLNNFYFYVTRNFYGVVKIYEGEGERKLYSGTTLHGKQFTDPKLAIRPSTYYGAGSGAGRAIAYESLLQKGKKNTGLNVGVIGLGTGSIAAYCSSTDRFVFYEIDARLEDIAREYFTYLPNCARGEVRIGDGRKLLEAELARGEAQKFDVFAVDAFSNDVIPAHLLTKESVALYLAHLKDDTSLLVIHTSNRYLELAPVVVRIADELGLASLVVNDAGDEKKYGIGLTSSEWVVLARDPAVFKSATFNDLESSPVERAPLWSDDYMNIFAALNLPAIYTWNK